MCFAKKYILKIKLCFLLQIFQAASQRKNFLLLPMQASFTLIKNQYIVMLSRNKWLVLFMTSGLDKCNVFHEIIIQIQPLNVFGIYMYIDHINLVLHFTFSYKNMLIVRIFFGGVGGREGSESYLLFPHYFHLLLYNEYNLLNIYKCPSQDF